MRAVPKVDFNAFPAGWFQIGLSADIAAGEVKTVHYFGVDIVLYRGESGVISALKPYCPHMGTHLGKGSVVVGDSLQCPLHHWCFKVDGSVSAVPNAKRMPDKARAGTYPIRALGGVVFIYYASIDDRPVSPFPEALEQLANTNSFKKSYFSRTLKTTILNQSENIVDLAHFDAVHSPPLTKGCIGDFEIDDRGDHLHVAYNISMKSAGTQYMINNRYHVVSPGQFMTYVTVSSSPFFNWQFATLSTPIDDNKLETLFVLMTKPVLQGVLGVSWLVNKLMHWNYKRNLSESFDQDISILENKIMLEKPILSDADGPIMKYRKWCAKFYPAKAGSTLAMIPSREIKAVCVED